MNNKIKLIIFVFIFIFLFIIIGSLFIQSGEEIKEEVDILDVQKEVVDNISIYGYTLDNPLVIIDPYKKNYNTALIAFNTLEYTSINVNVNDEYSYISKSGNKHYIGVYNLNTGDNYVILSYNGISKRIDIYVEETDNFIEIDNNILSNNHLIIPTYKYINNDLYTGISEVDIFGHIYFEYIIESGSSSVFCEIDDELLGILSNKTILLLDRQNGNIIKKIDISKYNINWNKMDYIDNKIILYSNDINIAIDSNNNITEGDYSFNYKHYNGDVNYVNKYGVRISKKMETKTSNINILLLNYSNLEEKIIIKKEYNRIEIKLSEIKSCNTYLILDKYFDRKVYKLCDIDNYIYTDNLSGKYYIYFMINNKIYKTKKYIKF